MYLKDVMYLDRRKRTWLYDGHDGVWRLDADQDVVVRIDYEQVGRFWFVCVGGTIKVQYQYETCFAAMEHYDHQPEEELR